MYNNPIKFRDIQDMFDDTNSIVVTALIINDEDDVRDFNDFLENIGFTKDKIIGYHKIMDNVLGEEGRTDYLFEFNNGASFNPIARLQVAHWLKWTSDFIKIYEDDYKH